MFRDVEVSTFWGFPVEDCLEKGASVWVPERSGLESLPASVDVLLSSVKGNSVIPLPSKD